MSDWAAKRFWTAARVVEAGDGFSVHLDSRPVRTPAKASLVVPTQGLADAIAAEWDAQSGKINPLTMPATRAANAAIDKVAPMCAEVIAMLADYGDADVTCYRAASPEELAARQEAAWDPLLDWADENYAARLIPVVGVMHHAQNADALAKLAAPMQDMSAFQLAGFHDLVALSGSLVIALATAQDQLTPQMAWDASRIDEAWQIDQWGADEQATTLAQSKRAAFGNAVDFFRLSTKIS